MSLLLHLNRLSFALFPGICRLCGDKTHRHMELCQACETELPRIIHPCPNCSLPGIASWQQARCGACLTNRPDFASCIAPFRYEAAIRHLHHRFKFRQDIAAGQLLADLLGDCIKQRQPPRPDLLIPVPMHWHRRLVRGFNQAELICQALAMRLRLQTSEALQRIRSGLPQQDLSRTARATNVAGAFQTQGARIAGRHLVLVDDILTTGATVASATKALLAAGAARVDVWCLARTVIR